MFDDMKVSELLKLVSALSGEKENSQSMHGEGDPVIVVLQRGHVAVGKWHQSGDYCWLTGASIVRRWGTTDGLGQLAKEGKQPETILDKSEQGIRFHILSVVCTFPCKDNSLCLN